MTPSPFSPQRKPGISIKEMSAEYRPQARLVSDGSTALSYAELLSIIIDYYPDRVPDRECDKLMSENFITIRYRRMRNGDMLPLLKS